MSRRGRGSLAAKPPGMAAGGGGFALGGVRRRHRRWQSIVLEENVLGPPLQVCEIPADSNSGHQAPRSGTAVAESNRTASRKVSRPARRAYIEQRLITDGAQHVFCRFDGGHLLQTQWSRTLSGHPTGTSPARVRPRQPVVQCLAIVRLDLPPKPCAAANAARSMTPAPRGTQCLRLPSSRWTCWRAFAVSNAPGDHQARSISR